MRYNALRIRLDQLERERLTVAAALEDRAEACRVYLRGRVEADTSLDPVFRSELDAFLEEPDRRQTIKRWILEALKAMPLTAGELRERFKTEWQDENKANSIRQYLRGHGLVERDSLGRYFLTKKGLKEVEK